MKEDLITCVSFEHKKLPCVLSVFFLPSKTCWKHESKEKKCKVYKMHLPSEYMTVLTRIHNDILRALDDGESVILVLLDLSAASDTIDHDILITKLKHRFGITGKALGWIQSYLSGRTQFVKIRTECSSSRNLFCGVSQGSVRGPILYSMYTTWTIIFMLMIAKFICLSSRVVLANQLHPSCSLCHAFMMLTTECQPISWWSITTKWSSLFCTPIIDHNPR